ncbi:MAG TPA: glycosyl hydrolase 108 family protein [Xanthobacteraceae bacterium]|nr:glycosyl hydrolase 108 family protein [Xanthobacteraceae bacterium]
MAKWTYDEALRRLLAHEGGYSNHPADPGGPTNFGITLADYRKHAKPNATAADVRAMTVDEAKTIYRAHYWDALSCDDLPAGVDYTVFDYGVNSGIGRSGKVLRRVLGLPDDTHVVNATVLGALVRRDPKAVVNAICDERLAFLKRLKTWPVFGRGWERRVAEVRAASLRMAAERAPAPVPDIEIAPAAGKGAVPAPAAAKQAVVGAGTVGPAAAGGACRDWVAAHPWEAAAIGCGLVLVVGGSLVLIDRWHRRRQEAAIPETPFVPELSAA